MFANPDQTIAQLFLLEGMKVADLGAGSGFYSKAASPKVGLTGHVYAVEVQKDMVKKLESDLKEWGIKNVSCIWGDIEKVHGTKISDKSIDAVILSNVLSQVEDKLGLIDEAKRIMKESGSILLVDWKEYPGKISSQANDSHRVLESTAEQLFMKRGLKKVRSLDVSEQQYGIIFA